MTAPATRTLAQRCQQVLDGLDTGCTTAEVRDDVEALRADVALCGVGDRSVPAAPETSGAVE